MITETTTDEPVNESPNLNDESVTVERSMDDILRDKPKEDSKVNTNLVGGKRRNRGISRFTPFLKGRKVEQLSLNERFIIDTNALNAYLKRIKK